MGHTYINRAQGGVLCATCGRWATTTRARQLLDHAGCNPAEVQKVLAQARVTEQAMELDIHEEDLTLTAPSCEIVAVAMQAADRLELQRQHQRQADIEQEQAKGEGEHGESSSSALAGTTPPAQDLPLLPTVAGERSGVSSSKKAPLGRGVDHSGPTTKRHCSDQAGACAATRLGLGSGQAQGGSGDDGFR